MPPLDSSGEQLRHKRGSCFLWSVQRGFCFKVWLLTSARLLRIGPSIHLLRFRDVLIVESSGKDVQACVRLSDKNYKTTPYNWSYSRIDWKRHLLRDEHRDAVLGCELLQAVWKHHKPLRTHYVGNVRCEESTKITNISTCCKGFVRFFGCLKR